ncbi:TonB-dependent siderophore receptor [Commensalibacter oyaizuii]|uniref:TonB-dependent siderophore receptor n=1 Tax=Commensalibacter oyaizuii TaxID=3043873 RepID=A0ABT6PYT9_9PROT|nr:TonB-dependent siderophore receptor [Commensalibacter sp. TBRC 16381]MDI2089979.1 TonB-dependent siderophore receptor [Commensalibacter sp. TBRC 16381]
MPNIYRSLLLLSSSCILFLSPALTKAQETTQNTDSSSKDEQIVVKGSKNPLIVKSSSTATKSSTPLIDTPESVSVVTAAQMQMQNAQTLGQALRYTSGVSVEQRGANSRYDLGTIRGFSISGSQYLDGLLMFKGQYYADQQIDPYLLQQIDVLKGPSSVVYGQSSPGGIVALTSKFANGSRYRYVSLEGGNYNYVRGTFDLGDKVGNLDNLSWRIVGTGFRQDGRDWYTKAERYAIQPSLYWEPTDDITLTVYGRYQADPSDTSYQTFPVYGTILPGPYHFPSNFYSGDKNFEKYDRTQASVGYNFTYQINPEWQFISRARYTNVGTNYNQVYGTDSSNPASSAGYYPGSRYMYRLANGSKEHLDTITIEEQLHGQVHTGPVKHDVLVGVSWQNLRDSFDYGSGYAPPLDLYHPNYSEQITIPTPTLQTSVTTNQEGIFLQDNMSYKRLHVQLGFRNDWSSIKTRNHKDLTQSFTQSDQAFTFRGGILYKLPHNISPYFSYGQSFQPLNQLSQQDQKPFKPTRGEQYEVGVKYQPEHFKGFFSAALYNLTQSNTLTPDPANPIWSIQAGGQRSRGVELEAHASPIAGLNLILSYTYQDVKYDKGDLKGIRPTQVPANIFSFWGDYTIQSGTFKNLGGSIGVRYNGNTLGDTSTFIKTPAYTLIDMQAHYRFDDTIPTLKGLDAQITAQNLTNKRYFSACYSQSFGCAIGQGRTVIGKLSYNW